MKKLFALVLALAMVLSMASVAMAASTKVGTNVNQGDIKAGDNMYKYDDDQTGDPFVKVTNPSAKVPYGETLYIPLQYISGSTTTNNGSNDVITYSYDYVTSADAVSGLKLSTKWDENGEYVENVEIAKKDGKFYIVIKTTGTSMDENDVEGTITVKGKGYEFADLNDKDAKKSKIPSFDVNVVITLGYEEKNGDEKDKDNKDISHVIPVDPTIFIFDENNGAMSDEEFEFTCDDDPDVTFTVDTTHQTDIVLSMNCDAIDEVEDNYPTANLDFYAFNGATFKKTGELFIPADEGTYLYEIVDNKAVEVDAEYDDYDEGFYLKTKTLGAYVVSDVKLETATAAAATEATATTANPTTGAAL